jgi:hypothetical protein
MIDAIAKAISGIFKLFSHNEELAELRKINEELVAKNKASRNMLKYESPQEFKKH